MIAKARIYLTADRSKLVPEGDPAAAYLLVAAGQTITKEIAAQYGIVDGSFPGTQSNEQIENRETRVPTVPKKRG